MDANTGASVMPKRKVGAGALAGALSTLLVTVLSANGVVIPPEAASALTTVIMFIVGYLVPEPK